MSSNEKAPKSPLAVAGPWDRVAEGYVTETVPFLEGYARRAMGLVEIAPSARVLDVAAGPGTLSFLLASRVKEVVAVDFAPSMIEQLRMIAVRDGVKNVEASVMDGQALSLPDASFDAAFSMFRSRDRPSRRPSGTIAPRTRARGSRAGSRPSRKWSAPRPTSQSAAADVELVAPRDRPTWDETQSDTIRPWCVKRF